MDIQPIVIIHIPANSHPLSENDFHLPSYTIENHFVDTLFCIQGSSRGQNPWFPLGKSKCHSSLFYNQLQKHQISQPSK